MQNLGVDLSLKGTMRSFKVSILVQIGVNAFFIFPLCLLLSFQYLDSHNDVLLRQRHRENVPVSAPSVAFSSPFCVDTILPVCPSLFEPASMFVFMSLCSFLHFLLCFPSASQKDMGLYSWRLLYPSQRGQKGNSVPPLWAVCVLSSLVSVSVLWGFSFS